PSAFAAAPVMRSSTRTIAAGLAMPRIACPNCQRVVTVDEGQRGTVVPCPQCGRRIRIPAAKTAPPPPKSPGPGNEPPPRPKAWPPVKSPPEEEPEDDLDDEGEEPIPSGSLARTATTVFAGLWGVVCFVALVLLVTGKWEEWFPELEHFLEDQGIPEWAA